MSHWNKIHMNAAGGQCCTVGISDRAHELPAALIILFADEVSD